MRPETIENYLKHIYHISASNKAAVSNSQLSERLNVKPATVTEALRRLHELNYVQYEKSYGTTLTGAGLKLALTIVRRHRIWETYLVQKLEFGWDEVHEIAEELEHIQNDKLINKLAQALGNPVYDPHGDPIPDERGKIKKSNFIHLTSATIGGRYIVTGVSEHSPAFLRYLEKINLVIGTEIKIESIEEFDGSMTILCHKNSINISATVAANIIAGEKG